MTEHITTEPRYGGLSHCATVHDIIDRLPTIDVLRRRCKAVAVLDYIISGDYKPRSGYRQVPTSNLGHVSGGPVYLYTRTWGDGEAALMSNGFGDEWVVVFTSDGAFIRGFDHDSPMSPYPKPDFALWPGLLDGLPAAFRPQIEQAGHCDKEGRFYATAVLWRLADDDRWHTTERVALPHGWEPEGSDLLGVLLADSTEEFVAAFEQELGIEVDPTAVEHVSAHRPLTDAVVQALNPEATLAGLPDVLAAIGYPSRA